MKKRIFPLLAVVLITALSSCDGGETTPVDLSIVPNPVSMVGCGKGVKNFEENPVVKTRINKKLAPEYYQEREVYNYGKEKEEWPYWEDPGEEN